MRCATHTLCLIPAWRCAGSLGHVVLAHLPTRSAAIHRCNAAQLLPPMQHPHLHAPSRLTSLEWTSTSISTLTSGGSSDDWMDCQASHSSTQHPYSAFPSTSHLLQPNLLSLPRSWERPPPPALSTQIQTSVNQRASLLWALAQILLFQPHLPKQLMLTRSPIN